MKKYVKLIIFVFLGYVVLSGCSNKPVIKDNFTTNLSECPSCMEVENNSVKGQAILTIYNDDGSRFLSNQTHLFCICNNIFIIKTRLYDQQTVLTLREDGELTALNGKDVIEKSPIKIIDAEIANLINRIIFADKENKVSTSKPVNVYGQWYKPLKSDSGYRYYVNAGNNMIDLIISNSYIARSYDYSSFEVFDHLVPTKIEIMSVGQNKSPGKKILKIDYKKFD